jgi:hypothetical protein
MLADQMLYMMTRSLRLMRDRGISTPHQRELETKLLRDIEDLRRILDRVGRPMPRDLDGDSRGASVDRGGRAPAAQNAPGAPALG